MKLRYFKQQNEVPDKMEIERFVSRNGCTRRQAKKYLLNETPLTLQYSDSKNDEFELNWRDVPIVIETRKESIFDGDEYKARFL